MKGGLRPRFRQRGFLLNPYRFGAAGPGPDVAFVAAASGGNTGGATSFTITIPTVATNDYMVLATIDREGGSGDKQTIADNDGGTWVTKSENGPGTGGWAIVAARYATSASSAKTITVSSLAATASGCGVLLVFRNVHLSSPMNVLTAGTSLTSGTESCATVTPTYSGGALVIAPMHRGTGTFSAHTTTNIGAFTEPASADVTTLEGSDCSASQAYILNPTLSATGTNSWNFSGAAAGIVFIYELQKA